jgi:membrane fusion protein (multidrug efflux system)
MKKTNVLIGLFAVLLTTLLSGCGAKDAGQTAERTTSVKAMVIGLSDEQLTKAYTGSLEGERQAVIYARIAEAVKAVRVRETEAVKAGQVLIELDRAGASSQYLATQSVYLNAEKNFKKMEFLFRQGAVSESQFDEARTQYEVNKASFEAAAQLVDIQSPINGVVTSLPVSPGDFLSVGQKLATVASVGRLRVKLGVNAEEIANFSVGAVVSVSSDDVSQTAEGKVTSVAASADPVNRTFEVEALIDNAAGYYRPGMFVKVHIILSRLDGVVTVPREAVLLLDSRQVVFVVAGGVAKKRPVTLGADLDGRVVIANGLAVGDTLVTLGQTYLDEGFKVTIASFAEGVK